eukprot:scaffold245460_cov32-Tisochrysis_lutea.AAC.1
MSMWELLCVTMQTEGGAARVRGSGSSVRLSVATAVPGDLAEDGGCGADAGAGESNGFSRAGCVAIACTSKYLTLPTHPVSRKLSSDAQGTFALHRGHAVVSPASIGSRELRPAMKSWWARAPRQWSLSAGGARGRCRVQDGAHEDAKQLTLRKVRACSISPLLAWPMKQWRRRGKRRSFSSCWSHSGPPSSHSSNLRKLSA